MGLLSLIPDAIKLPVLSVAAAAVGAGLMFYPAKWIGEDQARDAAEASAAKNALARIQTLEENNADFRKLSDRDRCLVFMRDSGLPDSACD